MLFAMELIAAAFVIIGVVWIIARVGLRPGGGSVQLPPVVDNSIGMWGVREIRARMLGADPDASPSPAVPPVTIVPQPFSAETARRLGIPRAMDLIEPSAGAKSAGRGQSKKAAAAGGAGAGLAAATTASGAGGGSATRVAAAGAAPATVVQRPTPEPGGAASTTAVPATEASGRRLSGVALAAMIAAAVLAGVLIGAAMAVIAPPSPGVVAGTGASAFPGMLDPSASPGS